MLKTLQSFRHPRLNAMLFLGLSSGLPLALVTSTLQAWFTEAGISIVTIGILSLVGIPYVWKFLWSPIMDRFVPPFLGRRRGWICITQLGLCFTLFLLANLNPVVSPGAMGILALLIAFLSASQDISIDAYRADILHASERGMGAAIFIFAYRMAMLTSGGLALIFADYFGWRLTYELMALLVGLLTIGTYFAPETTKNIQSPKTLSAAIFEPFMDLWRRPGIVVILLFVIFYKIGDAFALSLMSNFLLRGLGFSLTDVGIAFKFTGLVATIMGAFAGGILLSRWNLYRALMGFGLAQAFSNLMFMVLAYVGKNYVLLVSAIFIEQFCSGLTAAALLAFLMMLCREQYSATQFASLSALTAVGRVLIGPVAGVVVAQIGWTAFFGWSVLLSFPGLIFLTLMRTKVNFHAEQVEV